MLWYLLRLEPFSSLFIHLNDGHFDKPDRLFQVRTLTLTLPLLGPISDSDGPRAVRGQGLPGLHDDRTLTQTLTRRDSDGPQSVAKAYRGCTTTEYSPKP